MNRHRVFTTIWVFIEKERVDDDGNWILFLNGRKVVRGFKQEEEVDYSVTFDPVVKFASVQALRFEAAEDDLELEQMDVKTTYSNGDIDEKIYIEVPEGVEITKENDANLCLRDDDNINSLDLVCKHEKAMYGMKQAPRC